MPVITFPVIMAAAFDLFTFNSLSVLHSIPLLPVTEAALREGGEPEGASWLRAERVGGCAG